MEPLTKQDILLVKSLKNRKYTDNTMDSKSTPQERAAFKNVRYKLRDLAASFAHKYGASYGPFQSDYTNRNPLTRGGTLNHVWSVIYKGAPNKQYAAQISFVINTSEECMDVGFYFGRASSHNKSSEEKKRLEDNLRRMSCNLSDAIGLNPIVYHAYSSLIDFGFNTYYEDKTVFMDDWLNKIRQMPQCCKIIAKIKPDKHGIVSYELIDLYVNQVLFLMLYIDHQDNMKMPPQTPEQRARKMVRLAEIGWAGELFVLEQERKRLRNLKLLTQNYPKQVSLESDIYGYDILSRDDAGNDMYIEVKTTTRIEGDPEANRFYLSANEYQVFSANKTQYKLYRVYDIEGTPTLKTFNIDDLTLTPNGYIVNC